MERLAWMGVWAALLVACGQPVRIVDQSRPVEVRMTHPQPRPVDVRVTNPPGAARGSGPGTWINECQQIARLGASETRPAWLGRVEAYVEARRDRLVSITYPPGDGVDLALVCFSTHVD